MNPFIHELVLSGVPAASDEAANSRLQRRPIPPSLYASATWGLSPLPARQVSPRTPLVLFGLPLLPSYSRSREVS
jgi:hypothetical protein